MRKGKRLILVVSGIGGVLALATGLLLVCWSGGAPDTDPGWSPAQGGFDMAGAKKLTVEDVETLYPQVLLPTWMPRGIRLTEIYGEGGTVILVYSDRGETDYRRDNITIEMIGVGYEFTPESLLERYPAEKVEFGNNITGILRTKSVQYNQESPIQRGAFALFTHNYIEYIVSGVSGHHSKSEISTIVESMEPVGSRTVRKIQSP